MNLVWSLLLFLPLQQPGSFDEDLLQAHNNDFVWVEDEGWSFDEVRRETFQETFIPKDSFKMTKKLQSYWVKVFVPELEDSTDYYFYYWLPFDELEVYLDRGPPLVKKWNIVSDTSRFVDGHTYFSFRKEDLIGGTHFYMKGYLSNYRINRFFFQTINGKTLYHFTNRAPAGRLVTYDVFNMAYIGAIFIIFFYVLANYFYNREQVYLYYLLYLFSVGLYLFSRSTMVFDFFFPLVRSALPTLEFHVNYTVQYLIHFSYLWFAISFLNARKDYFRFYQVGRVMSGFFLFCIGVAIVSIEFFPRSAFWIYLYEFERIAAVVFTVIVQFYIFFHRKNQLANFLVIGSVFFIVGGFVSLIGSDAFYFRAGAILEIITFSLGLAYRMQMAESEKLYLEKEVERVKMVALRTQMKPHFLFNTINSIRALILKGNKEEAYEHLAVFSKLIRYVLESSESDLVTLKEEMKMLEIYVDMEKRRLSRDFSYEQSIASSIDQERTLLPPLILQPFIENSIIHGLAQKEGPKELKVTIEKQEHLLSCEVKDNGVGRAVSANQEMPTKNKSMAIDLTKQRISLLMPDKEDASEQVAIVDLKDEEGKAAGTQVLVSLPLILRT